MRRDLDANRFDSFRDIGWNARNDTFDQRALRAADVYQPDRSGAKRAGDAAAHRSHLVAFEHATTKGFDGLAHGVDRRLGLLATPALRLVGHLPRERIAKKSLRRRIGQIDKTGVSAASQAPGKWRVGQRLRLGCAFEQRTTPQQCLRHGMSPVQTPRNAARRCPQGLSAHKARLPQTSQPESSAHWPPERQGGGRTIAIPPRLTSLPRRPDIWPTLANSLTATGICARFYG